MAEAICSRTGALTLVPAAYLQAWLPGLVVPQGWCTTISDAGCATRMLKRQLGIAQHWDVCEVLNLYRAPGTVPEAVVVANGDRALRDAGADDIQTSKIDIERRYRVIAIRATGTLRIGTRAVRAQYNYYVVNAIAGAGVIEQVLLVGTDVYPRLASEIDQLTAILHDSLLASMDKASDSENVGNGGQAVHLADHIAESPAPSFNHQHLGFKAGER